MSLYNHFLYNIKQYFFIRAIRKVFFCLLLLSFVIPKLYAGNKTQNDSLFDKAFYYAATELAATNLETAISVADSLLKISKNNEQKVKSLMLLATLQERSGAVENALENALKAEKINSIDNNVAWAIRISGFLSTTFRGVGLNVIGLQYLKKAEAFNNKKFSPIFQTFIFQEYAFYSFEEEKYKESIDWLNKSIQSDSKIPKNQKDPLFLATTFQLLGSCYLNLKQHKVADSFFSLTLKELSGIESPLLGFAYSGLGEIAMHNNKVDTAFQLFEQARRYAEQSDNYNLKKSVYENLEDYYSLTQDFTKATEFKTKYLILSEERLRYINEVSKKIIIQIEGEKKTSKIIFNVSLVSITLIFLFALFILFRKYRRKNESDKLKYLEIIKGINERVAMEASVPENEAPISETDTPISEVEKRIPERETTIPEIETPAPIAILKVVEKKSMMPIETEERLLKALKKLELKNFFLKKEVSIASLATSLHTNQKYLSYLIKEHKEQDFSNYINELRINYILYKIQNDEMYLEYKIAHLAEECGFSSHSKFTQVFKDQTGMLPSTFIAQHKEENRV